MAVEIFPVTGLPDIEPGDDLPGLLVKVVAPLHPRGGDILVVTHKVVSKAEGAMAAAATDGDYRNVVASEAASIVATSQRRCSHPIPH